MEEKRELAQRCRPQTFDEVWGNREVLKTLQVQLEKEDRPQTYLFMGSAGCGKTTLARAFCNELHIDALDITEINASDKNGVDDIRELIEQLRYQSMGERRAVIFDECHMWSASAMSAALKLLEEPPKGTYLFLCTTDPQKLTPAIKSRCLQLQVQPLTQKMMVRKLKTLCEDQNIEAGMDVLDVIAEKSEGVPRYALKLLDKVSGLDDDSALAILDKEGSASDLTDPDVKRLCQLLIDGKQNWKEMSAVLRTVKGKDAEGVRRMILGYMSAVLLNSGRADVAQVMGCFTENFYDTGHAGLVYACYCALFAD